MLKFSVAAPGILFKVKSVYVTRVQLIQGPVDNTFLFQSPFSKPPDRLLTSIFFKTQAFTDVSFWPDSCFSHHFSSIFSLVFRKFDFHQHFHFWSFWMKVEICPLIMVVFLKHRQSEEGFVLFFFSTATTGCVTADSADFVVVFF